MRACCRNAAFAPHDKPCIVRATGISLASAPHPAVRGLQGTEAQIGSAPGPPLTVVFVAKSAPGRTNLETCIEDSAEPQGRYVIVDRLPAIVVVIVAVLVVVMARIPLSSVVVRVPLVITLAVTFWRSSSTISLRLSW